MVEILAAQFATLRAQVGSLQAQIDALQAVAEAAMRLPVESPAPPACPHLETENVGTFGAPEFRCTLCKAVVPA